MNDSLSHPVVISLGGSMIVTEDGIDTAFLKHLQDCVEGLVSDGRQVFIIAGGGQTARDYMKALKQFRSDDSEKIDRMGIAATRLNAHLVLSIFSSSSAVNVATNPDEIARMSGDIVVGAPADTPGRSSDFQAVKVAEATGSQHIVNLSNIDHVYNRDPKKYDDAVPLKEISWSQYLKLIPDEWTPGLHSPFDPTAAKAARKEAISVGILSGESLSEIQPFLTSESFSGTRIYTD